MNGNLTALVGQAMKRASKNESESRERIQPGWENRGVEQFGHTVAKGFKVAFYGYSPFPQFLLQVDRQAVDKDLLAFLSLRYG